jgi:ubiquinone/menaquinone biosynthesis C-methylase UbiE
LNADKIRFERIPTDENFSGLNQTGDFDFVVIMCCIGVDPFFSVLIRVETPFLKATEGWNHMTEHRDFDKAAVTWDDEPRRVQLARDVAAAIISAAQPTGEMDALDFGCGTGLLTLLLQPHVRSITGIDTSCGMLEVLERKVREWGLSNVRALYCDVGSGDRPEGAFHLIVSSMALHHVADLSPLFRLFYGLLLPGGILCIADLDKEDGTFHDDPIGVLHFGFDRTEVMEQLASAGFTDIRAVTAAVVRKSSPDRSRDYQIFLISARISDAFLTVESMEIERSRSALA